MRKICFITGTRAEYGIMSQLIRLVHDSNDCQLQIIATNMHLSSEFGLTYREIENDGFNIDKKVEMLLSSDTANGIVKSMGLATIGFADALNDLKPDLCVILGDRYEMLAAAQSALIYKIPIAHLYGGEITEGAYDDSIRHAITKLSHLHFTSTEEYKKRVIQLGEDSKKIFCVGALGIDNIDKEDIMSIDELSRSIDFNLTDRFVVVTFHPVTIEHHTAQQQCENLLSALEYIIPQYKILFTLPNSDTDGRIIISLIKRFVTKHRNDCLAITSLGKKRYYAALKYSSAVIGNSSSGLVEAPSFHIPTLNIGDRQKGRTRCESVIDCAANKDDILEGLHKVLSDKTKSISENVINPYYQKDTLNKIFEVISTYPLNNLIKKHFYDINNYEAIDNNSCTWR